MKVANMGVVGGGSGRPVNQLWLWTSSNNPDVVDEGSPENFQWTQGANLLPAQFTPPGTLALASGVPFTSKLQLYEGITYSVVDIYGWPVPPAWVRHVAQTYTLTNLNSWANFDNYSLIETPIISNGWMRVKIDVLDLAVPTDTVYLVVAEDDSVAYLYAGDIVIGTDVLLMPALVAANPGGFSAGELTVEWSINNG